MKKLRKFLVVSVMVLSTMFMGGFAFIAPASAASASAGDLIKMNGLSSVYYLGANGERYVFPNSTTYFSWYPDFSGVITIPASELQSYPLGGNVTMRPGTKLVKITTDPSVYAVSPDGVLHKIGNEAQAAALYGTNWAKRVVDVPDAFFTNYTIGAPLASGAIPAGSLVKNAGSANVYYYDGSSYSLVPSEMVASSNHMNLADAITVSTAITASGTAVASGQFANVAQNSTTGSNNNVATGSGLMVSLNANTAASNTIISTANGGQAIAPLASFNFTAANDGAVVVKSIKLHRTGVSSDNMLSNVYLYNGSTKLTDAGSFSNGYVTFSSNTGIITIPAGQTVTVSVKADVAANQTGGNIGVAIESANDVVASGSTISGSFPLNGNLMSITEVGDLATVTATLPTPQTAGNINAGTLANTLWSSQLSVSQKAVELKYVSFRQIGSVPADAIQNLKLYVNGTQVGNTASINSNGRVNFDLAANPVLLNTGNSTLELRGDIVKGSNYNYIFSVQTASDIVLVDTNYNVNVAITGAAGVSLPLSAAKTSINGGSVSIQRDTSFTATQFVANQAQTTLGQWTMKAYGENEKIQQLKVDVALTANANGPMKVGEGFNNVSLYVNGASVGSSLNAVLTATSTSKTLNLTFGSTNLFTIPVGQTVVLTVKGDSVLNTPTNVASVLASLIAPANEFQGVSSFTYSPDSAVTYTGITLTTGNSNATLSANAAYAGQNLSANTTKQKIGSYMIQAGSVDGVRVTSLNVGLASTTNQNVLTSLANLYIVTPGMPNGSAPISPSTSNNFSTNFTVPANGTAQVDVYADLGNLPVNQTTTSVKTTLSGNGTGVVSNQAVTLSSADGQTINVGIGSMASATLSNSSPVAQIVVGGTSGYGLATYNLVASTAGGVNITELGFTFGASTAVSSVTVAGHTANVVAEKALVTGLNLNVPASYAGVDVPVTVDFAPVGLNGVADQSVTMSLAHIKYIAGGTTTAIGDSASFTGDATSTVFANNSTSTPAHPMYLAGVAPAVSLVAAGGSLNTGTVKIGSVNIVAPTGNMVLTDLPLAISASGAAVATGTKIIVKDASNNSTITTTGGVIAGTSTNGTTTVTFSNSYTIASGTAGKTFDIYAVVSGITGAAGTARVNLGMGSNSLFKWNDVNGNQTAIDGSNILNYPNTTVSIAN